MLRLAFDFIITWRETRTRPNAYDNSGQDAAYGYPKQPFSGCRQQAACQQSRRKPANICPQPCSLQPVNKNQSMNKTGIRIVYIFAKYTFII